MIKKVGLIINPIAGIGGRAGFKGSDDIDIQDKSLALGYTSSSIERAKIALKELIKIKDKIKIHTYIGDMGEIPLKDLGFSPIVYGEKIEERTSRDDTLKAASILKDKVDFLIFAGGDGTARDIYTIIKDEIPVLGIPTGVKIHSACYGINPRNAGLVCRDFIDGHIKNTKLAEIMDIDEELFRQGEVSAKLYGYMKVPAEEQRVQSMKSGGYSEDANLMGMAAYIVDNMEEDIYYIIGPGTTPKSIMDGLEIENTLLGMDLIKNKKLIKSDLSEKELWELIKDHNCKIVITIIGGQGHLFGRGNQQLSPRIIRKVGMDNIIIMASKSKILSLKGNPILSDTSDIELDKEISGFIRVLIGYGEHTIKKIIY